MRTAFTRDTVSPGHAKYMIWCAALVSAMYGFITLVIVLRRTPGVTPLQLLDAGILLTAALGIVRRKIWAAWVGFVYFALDAVAKALIRGAPDVGGTASKLIIYALAIIYIGLYPRPTSASSATLPQVTENHPSEGDHHGAV
jgi:hypothetical protein